MAAYFNTTNKTGEVLTKSIKTATSQKNYILALLLSDRVERTPSEIYKHCQKKGIRYILTSIRRALSVLTKEEHLTKMDKQKIGIYGEPEHYWQIDEAKYPEPSQQLKLL